MPLVPRFRILRHSATSQRVADLSGALLRLGAVFGNIPGILCILRPAGQFQQMPSDLSPVSSNSGPRCTATHIREVCLVLGS